MSTNGWMDKDNMTDTHTHTHTHTQKMEYYSAVKKKGITPAAATWMDLTITTRSEAIQKENSQWHPYMQNLKRNYTNEFICKTDSQT